MPKSSAVPFSEVAVVPENIDQSTLKRLCSAALAVQEYAYAPYSRFKVGAAILAMRGNIYAGCNVECVDYDGTHAEESAISAMVGGKEYSPAIFVVYGALEGDAPRLVKPCGKCRQKLYEFALSMMRAGSKLSIVRSLEPLSFYTIDELLRDAFGPADIGIDLSKYYC